MAFDLGAFAGGIGQGIEQGEDIRRKQREAEAQRRMDMAQRAAGQAEIAGLNSPQQPSPQPQGGQLQPQGANSAMGGQPTNVPVPGARPMPQAQPPAAQAQPQPQPAPQPQPQGQPALRPAPQVAPTPRPMPQPMGGPQGQPQPQPQGQPPGGPGGLQPGGQGGPPGGGQQNDPIVQMSQQTQAALKSMYQAVITANPKLKGDPQTAFQAVDAMIAQLKGVDQSDKSLMAQQNQILKLQYGYWKDLQDNTQRGADTDKRVGAEERGQDTRAHTAEEGFAAAFERVKYAQTEQDRRAAEADATRIGVANIDQAGANGRVQATLDFRQKALDAGMDEKQWETQTRAALIQQGFSEKYVDTLLANPQAQGAAPVKRPVPQPLPAPPGRGEKGAPAAGGPPPEALKHLKEGVVTTFGNGQKWTLKGGKPVKVG